MKFKLLITSLIIFLLLFSMNSYATEYHTKQWTVVTIIGSFPQNEKIKYYLEPQLRLINNRYVFEEGLFFAALGYQLTPSLRIFVGPGYVARKNSTGMTFYEYRFWQQLMWQMVNSPSFTLNSRTRLEERKRDDRAETATRLRERLWLRIPIQNADQVYFSIFDEAFFNLNHPRWVSRYFFEQNRAFFGIGKQITKSTIMDFGYLSQIQFGPPRQVSHIVFLSFSVTY